jgi:acetyl esterase
MDSQTQAAPLDPIITEMERKWRDSGIPGLCRRQRPGEPRTRAQHSRSALSLTKPAAGHIERSTFPGPTGSIAIETVWPVEGEPLGMLVYYHGGGHIIGDIDSHQAHAIRFTNSTRVVVVNVDYRVAPEHPFLQGVDDAIAAAQWASQNLARLGGAARPLAVGATAPTVISRPSLPSSVATRASSLRPRC